MHENNLDIKASICSQPNGVACTEDLPLGLKATHTYSVASRDQLAEEQIAQSEKEEAGSESSLINFSTVPLDRQLYLVEEKSAIAWKPLASFVRVKDDKLALKTENLLRMLECLGRTQKDTVSALAELNGMRTHVDADIDVEKAKNE